MTQEEFNKIRETIKDIDWNNKDNKVSESLLEEILENAPEVNGIRITDYLLENGEFTRPQKGLSEDKVVGIVAGFHNNEPIIASLKFFNGIFDRKCYSTFGKSYYISKEVKKAFDGQIITYKYKEGKREDRFEAFEACLNYRKNKNEEWYLGAVGEVATMLNNWVYLNAAYRITGLGTIINHGNCYTTCSERDCNCSWYCQLLRFIDPDCFWYDKGTHKLGDCVVVPFLDYENYKNKIIKYNNAL